VFTALTLGDALLSAHAMGACGEHSLTSAIQEFASMQIFSSTNLVASVALSISITATNVPSTFAHEGLAYQDFGEPGDVSNVTRTFEINLYDNYYEPETLEVQAGETVKFVVKNGGELLHEFNLGTVDMHMAHQKEMRMMMDHGMLTPTGMNHEMMNMDHSAMGMPAMKHDDPNSVLVEPGETKELVWHFHTPIAVEFACNIPGHYQAGMVGDLEVKQ